MDRLFGRGKRKKPVAPGVKMDVTAKTSGAVAVAIAAFGVLLVILLAWIGGELHHHNCLAQAQAEGEPVAGCSRWPF